MTSSKKLWPSSRKTSCEISVHRRASARGGSQACSVRRSTWRSRGYYIWRKRPMSQHNRKDGQLAAKVKAAFQANRCVYGSPRVHAELHAQGIHCARKRVARLMRDQGLFAQRPRHRTVTTASVSQGPKWLPICSNATRVADEPTTKWVADTTSIWTAEGWLYLAVVLDLFSRLVGGWSMAAIQDATLVTQALRMAVTRRRKHPGLLHHSDRGSTYTSEDYQSLLRQEGMRISMSRTADCYENAAAESFFHRFKGECIDGESFQTRAQARSTTFDDIECFSNRTRRHSTLQYVSPFQYEQLMC